MTAYEAGCERAVEKLALDKHAFIPLLAGAARIGAGLFARGAAGAGARAVGGGMFRNALSGLGKAMNANRGMVAMNGALGAASNWDPNNPTKALTGAALGAVTAPFGMKGFMANTAGNMLMNSGS